MLFVSDMSMSCLSSRTHIRPASWKLMVWACELDAYAWWSQHGREGSVAVICPSNMRRRKHCHRQQRQRWLIFGQRVGVKSWSHPRAIGCEEVRSDYYLQDHVYKSNLIRQESNRTGSTDLWIPCRSCRAVGLVSRRQSSIYVMFPTDHDIWSLLFTTPPKPR